MENKVVKTMIGAVALSSSVIAGPIAGPIETVASPSHGDFCASLKSIGKLYKNSDNPYIQEVSVFGRAHVQYGYVDGNNAAGQDFSQDFEDIRRARVGVKVKAFNGLEILGRINVVNDGNYRGRDRDWGYEGFDEAYFKYNFGTVAGIEDFSVGYGRYKIAVGAEGQQSSKKIKTVERSAIANKVFTNRYTSLLLSGKRGNVDATFGVLSLDDPGDFIGKWDAGHAIFVDSTITLGGHDYDFDALYNFDEGSNDDEVGMDFRFATSLATNRDIAGWDVLFNVIYGHNGTNPGNESTGGSFWGVVIQPSKYIIEDKLESVFRYQYQGATQDNGISALRRYSGQALNNTGEGRTGDEHHSIYAGLNYYLCGDNSKVMVGVEYENLSTPTGDADATTLWAAYRMYF